MLRYLGKRALSALVALFLYLTVMFFVVEIVIPHDFTTQFALQLNREQREELAEELGLDRPLGERYVNWLRRLFSGSLGTSFYGEPVVELIKSLIPFTLVVFFIGTMIAFMLGQWLGKATAWRGGGLLSGAATFGAVTLYTTFPPWLAFLMTYALGRRLQMFRTAFGYRSAAHDLTVALWMDAPFSPQDVMLYIVGTFAALLLLMALLNWALTRTKLRRLPPLLGVPLFVAGLVGSWYLLGFGPHAIDICRIAWLPLLAYVLLSFGDTMLIMQTSMMDTMKEDYVGLARAKGLPTYAVRDRHAARNALLPVLSRLVISFPYLLTGLVIIEDTFDLPGLSRSLFLSLYQQDMPMAMGTLLVVGIIAALVRFVLDFVYMLLDPRVRHRVASAGGRL